MQMESIWETGDLVWETTFVEGRRREQHDGKPVVFDRYESDGKQRTRIGNLRTKTMVGFSYLQDVQEDVGGDGSVETQSRCCEFAFATTIVPAGAHH